MTPTLETPTPGPAPLPGNSRHGRARHRLLGWMCWVYLLLVLVVWLLLRTVGERWWVVTMVLFAPRWAFAVPAAVLAPVAALRRRRCVWPAFAAGAIALFPIAGLRVGWSAIASGGAGDKGRASAVRLRVLTCNIHEREL